MQRERSRLEILLTHVHFPAPPVEGNPDHFLYTGGCSKHNKQPQFEWSHKSVTVNPKLRLLLLLRTYTPCIYTHPHPIHPHTHIRTITLCTMLLQAKVGVPQSKDAGWVAEVWNMRGVGWGRVGGVNPPALWMPLPQAQRKSSGEISSTSIIRRNFSDVNPQM